MGIIDLDAPWPPCTAGAGLSARANAGSRPARYREFTSRGVANVLRGWPILGKALSTALPSTPGIPRELLGRLGWRMICRTEAVASPKRVCANLRSSRLAHPN